MIDINVTSSQHNPYNKPEGGDGLVIDFDEQRFINEVKNMVRPFGLGKSQVKKIVYYALEAVRKSCTPIRWY